MINQKNKGFAIKTPYGYWLGGMYSPKNNCSDIVDAHIYKKKYNAEKIRSDIITYYGVDAEIVEIAVLETKELPPDIHVYCTDCEYFEGFDDNDIPHCKYEKECYIYDIPDSRHLSDRKHWSLKNYVSKIAQLENDLQTAQYWSHEYFKGEKHWKNKALELEEELKELKGLKK